MSVPPGRRSAAGTRMSRAAARAAARRARRRKQLRIAGIVGAALLVLLGGWAAVAALGGNGDSSGTNDTAGGRADDTVLADPDKALLDPATAKQLSAGTWAEKTTTDTGDTPERAFICQAQRFADAAGLRTWVRVLRNANNLDTATQYVEVSNDAAGAKNAYTTVVGWLSECNTPKTRLVDSWVIKGLGERGVMAVFSQPVEGDRTAYRTISVVSTGPATMVLQYYTTAKQPPATAKMLAGATAAMQRICAETETPCGDGKPTLQWQLLKTSEPPGFMAPIDLPVVGDIDKPWVGVKASTRDGTGCEKLDLQAAKATKSRFQTYVVPEAKVPTEFGIDTMVAQFADYNAANQFVVDVVKRVDNCKKNFSTATVERTGKISDRGISGQTWRLRYDTGRGKLTYRVAMVRVSDRAVYVMFPVLENLDMGNDTFEKVVIRAGERSLYFR